MKKKTLLLLGALLISSSIFYNCSSDDNNRNPDDPDGPESPEVPETPKEGTYNYKTFDKAFVAFADGQSQAAEGTFTFPTDIEKVKTIKMYIQNECPDKSCDEWDRYANVSVKNKTTGEWYEIGRFITPYWVGLEELERGLEFDVTDFKSLLNGETELRIYTETWLAKGREYSVDFDFIYGETAYKYSAVTPILQYNESSQHGVPYGKDHNFDLTKSIKLPENTEQAYIRTIISGWGHATPNDAGGRGCAEWCFRTHNILIDGTPTFEHYLGPIGCANNPIGASQAPGSWKGDRAGWCPGMAVPTRIDVLTGDLANKSLNFEYQFTDWTNNGRGGDAFYAISNFVVVHSKTPITPATILE